MWYFIVLDISSDLEMIWDTWEDCTGNMQMVHGFIYWAWATADFGIYKVLKSIPHEYQDTAIVYA
jgi:hypothetical protein